MSREVAAALVGRGGCQHRRQSLVNRDHGGAITSRWQPMSRRVAAAGEEQELGQPEREGELDLAKLCVLAGESSYWVAVVAVYQRMTATATQ
jgi:hypothetical protein